MASSVAEVKALYRSFLRVARDFPHYNLRHYIKRRAETGFRKHASDTDPESLKELWSKAKVELEVAKRQSVLYGMYERPQKSVLDTSKRS
uniref:Mitochondrial protein of lyr family n=1 Tax=Tetraselmis sp. GSL018 TaxID=582737 RepID=A0A061R8E6_9CHLO|mmetsp:Transcript_10306/g.24549  ORF Transcript_10306/g.24549 Transcript_10306/m.24549 type:complete len:90 (-) Transcript_10306:37-306(-)